MLGLDIRMQRAANPDGRVGDQDLLLGTFSSLLNLPASAVAERNRMLFVEPAGGAPELFDRGFKYLFFAQQATADKQGDAWANWLTTELPESERPKTAAYPTLDDPFARPTRSTTRTTTRSRTRSSRAGPSSWSTGPPSRTASAWSARS